MGRPNKGSSLTEKSFDNYSASDNLMGFEAGGSTHKYNIGNVSKYALEKQTLSAGGKSGTVKSIIDGLTPRIKKTEDGIAAFETTVAEANAAVTELSGRVNAMESGPLVAATSSAMVDTTRIYVYTGEELGMTAGDWYYHNGTDWVSGGVYNAVAVSTDDTLSVEDVPADAKAVGDAFDEMDVLKANTDGVYESMTVGNAEQLIGSVFTEDSVPYNFRTSGGSIDIGDREIDKLVGGTVAWNQKAGEFTVTNDLYGSVVRSGNEYEYTVIEPGTSYKYGIRCLTEGSKVGGTEHKVLVTCLAKASVSGITIGFDVSNRNFPAFTPNSGLLGTEYERYYAIINGVSFNVSYLFTKSGSSVGDKVYFKDIQIFDLTQMFGSAIADYIYSLERTTEGAGLAFFRKLFPKPYYPYNAGELMSVKALSHKTVGFNMWDEDWEGGYINTSSGGISSNVEYIRSKNFCRCVPGATICMTHPQGTQTIIYFYDAAQNYITASGNESDAYKLITTPDNAHYFKLMMHTTHYENNVCINLSWDGERDGEYEEYVEHVYPLDSNLTLRGVPKLDSSNKLYYDGDTYESDGTVKRKYGTLTASGSETVTMGTSSNYTFFDIDTQAAMDAIAWETKLFTNIWPSIAEVHVAGLTIAVQLNASKKIRISLPSSDTTFQSVDALKTYLTSHPLTVLYPLAEPVEETAAPYQNPQVVDDFGTEEYVDSRTVPIPVGHETKYANNLRAKLEMAPDSPDGNGDYIVRHTNGENEYTPLVIPKELPNTPSEDGIYHLKVTVVNGAAGLSWESEA